MWEKNWGTDKMSEILVAYKSVYGTTEKYAKLISEALGGDLINLKTTKKIDFDKYKAVLYGGGIYGGGINGLKAFFSAKGLDDKNIVIFTCGISNDAEKIKQSVQKTVPDVYGKAKLFCLKGAIDYSKLGFVHRSILSFMIRGLKSKQNLDETEKIIVNLQKSKADFFDESAVNEMIEYVKSFE